MKKHFQRFNVIRSARLFTFMVIAAVVGNIAIVNRAAAYNERNPDGSINVGRDFAPVNFTILTYQNFTLNDPGTFVTGNAGVGASGQGDYQGNNQSQLRGDLYIDKQGHINVGGGSTITGTRHQDTGTQTSVNTLLSNAWADALSLSSTTAGLAATNNYTVTSTGVSPPPMTPLTNVNLDHGANITITDNTPGTEVVLKLQNFQLNNASSFTLSSTATNVTFIIDVMNGFSLDHASQIKLGGVLSAANVLFNVLNSDVNINNMSKVSGTFLATTHKFNLDGGSKVVQGRVIAKEVEIHNGSQVVSPILNN